MFLLSKFHFDAKIGLFLLILSILSKILSILSKIIAVSSKILSSFKQTQLLIIS
tara:strand:- start:2130 stop:2291 length:162 start_codon:yes stop_codon:yes gene_type:complete